MSDELKRATEQMERAAKAAWARCHLPHSPGLTCIVPDSGGYTVWTGPFYIQPSTPAAMLGAAADLLARAERLLADAGQRDWAGAACHIRLTIERQLIPATKPEAEALEAERILCAPLGPLPAYGDMPQDSACWQCDAVLGTTEACTTCAAKRREGQG